MTVIIMQFLPTSCHFICSETPSVCDPHLMSETKFLTPIETWENYSLVCHNFYVFTQLTEDKIFSGLNGSKYCLSSVK
jgi:hypothetical protein